MSRNVSTNLQSSAYAQETDKVLIALITIDHASFDNPIRVCDDPLEDFGGQIYGVTSRGNQFVFLDFEVTLPDEDEELVQYLDLKIDNTDRSITAAIREAAASGIPPTATAEIVLHDNPDVVDMTVTGLKLKTVTYDQGTVSAKLSTEHTDRQVYPTNFFRPSLFPGIFDGVG